MKKKKISNEAPKSALRKGAVSGSGFSAFRSSKLKFKTMIQGWYYLHTNKELIYKNNPDAIGDIRESDFCHSAWGWDGQRPTAWQILVEANALGANKERINELSKKWGCDDKDAENYAKHLGIEIGMDGNACFARRSGFINLQESECGFGDTYLDAMSDLATQLGYVGGKMWNATFKDVVSA